MKRIGFVLCSLFLIITLASCSLGTYALEGEYEGYYLRSSGGIVSITNYHPFSTNGYPSYQELVEYGDGAGLENDGVVYYIMIVDILEGEDIIDSSSVYYCAELDGETKEILSEENYYFSSDELRDAALDRLLTMIDDVKDEYLK
ncbi:MAG: hypothetical protein IJX92_00275 [Clostridia bacterium]|nr:hypothetical protein [Clostridia bacterium]